MENHRKMTKEAQEELYDKVIIFLLRAKFPIETIRWASARYVNREKKLPRELPKNK